MFCYLFNIAIIHNLIEKIKWQFRMGYTIPAVFLTQMLGSPFVLS